LSLALSQSGWQVVVHYGQSAEAAVETVAEIERRGGRACCVSADLADPLSAAETVLDRAEEAFGQVNLLVNNAAVFEGGTLAETDPETWRRLFAINLQAPYFFCQRFVAGLGEEASGQIINLVDWRGIRLDPRRLAYSLTKQALVGLTCALAGELAPRVRVNAVAPGPVLPPPGTDAAVLEAAAAETPLQRTGSPADVVAAVRYLVDAELVTGEVLSVAGGAQLP
jgi:NAD(P)-dependent dehydrogenase (short-subunit alcohol dehydrogenase family)